MCPSVTSACAGCEEHEAFEELTFHAAESTKLTQVFTLSPVHSVFHFFWNLFQYSVLFDVLLMWVLFIFPIEHIYREAYDLLSMVER